MSAEQLTSISIRDNLEPFIGKIVDKEVALELGFVALGGESVVNVLQDHLYEIPTRVNPDEIIGSEEATDLLAMSRQAMSIRRTFDPLFPPSIKRVKIMDLILSPHFETYSKTRKPNIPERGRHLTEDDADRMALGGIKRLEGAASLSPVKPSTENTVVVEDLLDITGIAKTLDISVVYVRMSTAPNGKKKKAGFPEPVRELHATRLWLRSDVEAYWPTRPDNRGKNPRST